MVIFFVNATSWQNTLFTLKKSLLSIKFQWIPSFSAQVNRQRSEKMRISLPIYDATKSLKWGLDIWSHHPVAVILQSDKRHLPTMQALRHYIHSTFVSRHWEIRWTACITALNIPFYICVCTTDGYKISKTSLINQNFPQNYHFNACFLGFAVLMTDYVISVIKRQSPWSVKTAVIPWLWKAPGPEYGISGETLQKNLTGSFEIFLEKTGFRIIALSDHDYFWMLAGVQVQEVTTHAWHCRCMRIVLQTSKDESGNLFSWLLWHHFINDWADFHHLQLKRSKKLFSVYLAMLNNQLTHLHCRSIYASNWNRHHTKVLPQESTWHDFAMLAQ